MAMQEEHIMDIALNSENYCSAIHRRQRYFVAGASVRMRGARMFTPQMIAGSTQKEGMYHFLEMKGTALSLMVPNMGSKWKWKKDALNTFKVSTTGRLVTFTTEIFGIPLMKHSRYALKHCLVDVKGIREPAMLQKRLLYLPRVSEASWNIHTNAARQGMVYQCWSITFSHFTDRMIP
jgi:hypothetical protein